MPFSFSTPSFAGKSLINPSNPPKHTPTPKQKSFITSCYPAINAINQPTKKSSHSSFSQPREIHTIQERLSRSPQLRRTKRLPFLVTISNNSFIDDIRLTRRRHVKLLEHQVLPRLEMPATLSAFPLQETLKTFLKKKAQELSILVSEELVLQVSRNPFFSAWNQNFQSS